MIADDEDEFRGLTRFEPRRFSGVDCRVIFQGLVQPWSGRARRRRQRREEDEASHHGVESLTSRGTRDDYARAIRR